MDEKKRPDRNANPAGHESTFRKSGADYGQTGHEQQRIEPAHCTCRGDGTCRACGGFQRIALGIAFRRLHAAERIGAAFPAAAGLLSYAASGYASREYLAANVGQLRGPLGIGLAAVIVASAPPAASRAARTVHGGPRHG